MDHVCSNLEDYDLEDFPDEFLIKSVVSTYVYYSNIHLIYHAFT